MLSETIFLLEEAKEEIENLYGRETGLTKRIAEHIVELEDKLPDYHPGD